MNNNYLYHHGILGQRWGVRRYQNKDGSYTEAGMKRYGSVGKDTKVSVRTIRKERKTLRKEYKTENPNMKKREIKNKVNEELLNKYGTKRMSKVKRADILRAAIIVDQITKNNNRHL